MAHVSASLQSSSKANFSLVAQPLLSELEALTKVRDDTEISLDPMTDTLSPTAAIPFGVGLPLAGPPSLAALPSRPPHPMPLLPLGRLRTLKTPRDHPHYLHPHHRPCTAGRWHRSAAARPRRRVHPRSRWPRRRVELHQRGTGNRWTGRSRHLGGILGAAGSRDGDDIAARASLWLLDSTGCFSYSPQSAERLDRAGPSR